jgi:ankyrin repeat protein
MILYHSGHHAGQALTLTQLAIDFLENETKVEASTQAIIAVILMGSNYGQVKGAVVALLKNGHNPNFKDTNGQIPLSYAARNRYEAVVKLMLE